MIQGPNIEELEASFFRGLNSVAEPLVRAGFGAPGPCGIGLIVLETMGRKTGHARNIPLLAHLMGEYVVVGTVRNRRSQWLRNLSANPRAHYWLYGVRHKATAYVAAPWLQAREMSALPSALRASICAVLPMTRQTGFGFAILARR